MIQSSDNQLLALQLSGIAKRFEGVVALEGVDLDMYPGEIHALLGENGAGKSTLIKVIAGVQPPDAGEIRVGGHLVAVPNPKEARQLGISLVPQDVLMVRELSIGRNILLGLETRGARRGGLSTTERALVDDALRKVGASFDATASTTSLSVPHLRLAQIARALIEAGRVMVLDEPTAVLSEPDADHLHERLQHFSDEGRAILYVTHRLSEVMRLADRLTILRDGRRVGVFRRGEISREEIVRLMTKTSARDRAGATGLAAAPGKAPRLEVHSLTAWPSFSEVGFSVPPGRIVGLAGVQGSGHGHLLRAVAGVDPIDSGSVLVDGLSLPGASVRAAIGRGVLFVPADRRGAAIVPSLSVRANLAIGGRIREGARRWGLRWHRAERAMMQEYVDRLCIRPPSTETRIAHLSGGNQQKVALARALEGNAAVLLVEEPTQGIDIGAKAEIHALLRQLAQDRGCAIVIATSEFEELIGLAEEIHVMCAGRIVRTLPGHAASYHAILESALL